MSESKPQIAVEKTDPMLLKAMFATKILTNSTWYRERVNDRLLIDCPFCNGGSNENHRCWYFVKTDRFNCFNCSKSGNGFELVSACFKIPLEKVQLVYDNDVGETPVKKGSVMGTIEINLTNDFIILHTSPLTCNFIVLTRMKNPWNIYEVIPPRLIYGKNELAHTSFSTYTNVDDSILEKFRIEYFKFLNKMIASRKITKELTRKYLLKEYHAFIE